MQQVGRYWLLCIIPRACARATTKEGRTYNAMYKCINFLRICKTANNAPTCLTLSHNWAGRDRHASGFHAKTPYAHIKAQGSHFSKIKCCTKDLDTRNNANYTCEISIFESFLTILHGKCALHQAHTVLNLGGVIEESVVDFSSSGHAAFFIINPDNRTMDAIHT
jgi:hypothetical protein